MDLSAAYSVQAELCYVDRSRFNYQSRLYALMLSLAYPHVYVCFTHTYEARYSSLL